MQIRRFGLLHGWSEAATPSPVKAQIATTWVVLAMPIARGRLMAARTRGTVAAVDRNAVFELNPTSAIRPRRMVTDAAMALVILILVLAPPVGVIGAVALSTGTAWIANLIFVLIAPTVLDAMFVARFARPGRPAAPPDARWEIHLGASFAAWPAGQGHGTRLFGAFAQAVDAAHLAGPVAVDIYPRQGLRDFYADHGFEVLNPETA